MVGQIEKKERWISDRVLILQDVCVCVGGRGMDTAS